MRDLLSIGTSRGCEMIGVGVGLGLSEFRLNSPWNPTKLAGLQFWVDASDALTLYTDSTLTTLAVADGDPIGGWKDKSGNSRNALQTDGTKKPLLKLAIQNGRNVVRFDGVNDRLTLSATAQSQPSTVLVVAKITGSNDILIACNPYSSPYYLIVKYNGYIIGPNGYDTYLSLDSNFNQITSYYSTISNQVRLNGINGTAGTNFSGSSPIGEIGDNSTNGAPAIADISEIILYDSVLSNSNILLVEAYLKAKWGTP